MKKVLASMASGGDVWAVMHRFTLASERYYRIRPIHVWTFLGAHGGTIKGGEAFQLLMAIENKLVGVRLARSRLRQALTYAVDPCYSHGNVQEYEGEQQVMFDLESYLNCIYSTLEITATVNKYQDASLPRNFRKQAKKKNKKKCFPLFSFSLWPWLPEFLDLRSLLTHYASSFPLLKEKTFMLEVVSSSGLEVFTKGKQVLEFDTVLSYAEGLFALLDMWALHKLQSINPDVEVPMIRNSKFIGSLRIGKTTARPFLRMAQRFQREAIKSLAEGDMRDQLSSITLANAGQPAI